MMLRLIIFLIGALIYFPALAGPDLSGLISRDDYEKLAADLAPKVNIFRAAWALNPEAEFYGGTTRDYLYWIRGQISKATDAEDLKKIIADLKSRETIDVSDFIIGQSDIDIISSRSLAISGDQFGLKKVDIINPSRFDPATPQGQQEFNQGHIPVEKIRLGQDGFVVIPLFGDGIQEIYEGAPTIAYASKEKFESTYFAQQKINHPILLMLRYLRLLGINYFYLYGRHKPNSDVLLNQDAVTKAKIREVVNDVISNPDFAQNIKNPRFRIWIDGIVEKAFRSHTNPTAAFELYKHYGVDEIVEKFELPPINQYLFAKAYDTKSIAENLRAFGITSAEFFSSPAALIPKLKLYHGTTTESAFKSILLQGVFPSTGGTAGQGLYAAPEGSLRDVIKYYAIGNENNVVSFKISPEARMVDMHLPIVQKVYNHFIANFNLGHESAEIKMDKFADYFGIDAIKYLYRFNALVIKNSSILSRPEGYKRGILTYGKLLVLADEVKSTADLEKFILNININRFTFAEVRKAIERIKFGGFGENIKSVLSERQEKQLGPALSSLLFPLLLNMEYFNQSEKNLSTGTRESISDEIVDRMGLVIAAIAQDNEKSSLVAEVLNHYRGTTEKIVGSWTKKNSAKYINYAKVAADTVKFFWNRTESIRGRLIGISAFAGYVTFQSFWGVWSTQPEALIMQVCSTILDLGWFGMVTLAQFRDSKLFTKRATDEQNERRYQTQMANALLDKMTNRCEGLFTPAQ